MDFCAESVVFSQPYCMYLNRGMFLELAEMFMSLLLPSTVFNLRLADEGVR